MKADKLIHVINGMLFMVEKEEKPDDWTKDFLNHIKSALEQQQKELSILCPIADLPVIESLKIEKLMYMEQISEQQKEIERLQTIIEDAVSVGEMQGENFLLEPWSSLKNA